MNNEQLIISVDDGGNIVVDAQGFTGEACLESSRRLLESIRNAGVEVSEEEVVAKPEMRQMESSAVSRKQGLRQ